MLSKLDVVEQGEIIPDDERAKLVAFGQGLAEMNETVNSMRGVRRGVVVRAFELESKRLARARLENKYGKPLTKG